MGAYNRTDGEPCCGSEKLQHILRGEWGFQGHFVSDCWAIRDFHTNHMVTSTAEESAALAINNGCDLNCGVTYLYVQKACEDGWFLKKPSRKLRYAFSRRVIFWDFLTRQNMIRFLIWKWSPKSIWHWQKKQRRRALSS